MESTEDEEVSTNNDQVDSKPEAESVTTNEHIDVKKKEKLDIVFKADTDTGPNGTMYKNLIVSVPGLVAWQASFNVKHMTVAKLHSPACWHGERPCSQWEEEARPAQNILVTDQLLLPGRDDPSPGYTCLLPARSR